jgi:hypothetical protein
MAASVTPAGVAVSSSSAPKGAAGVTSRTRSACATKASAAAAVVVVRSICGVDCVCGGFSSQDGQQICATSVASQCAMASSSSQLTQLPDWQGRQCRYCFGLRSHRFGGDQTASLLNRWSPSRNSQNNCDARHNHIAKHYACSCDGKTQQCVYDFNVLVHGGDAFNALPVRRIRPVPLLADRTVTGKLHECRD